MCNLKSILKWAHLWLETSFTTLAESISLTCVNTCRPLREGYYTRVLTGRSLIKESCTCDFTNLSLFTPFKKKERVWTSLGETVRCDIKHRSDRCDQLYNVQHHLIDTKWPMWSTVRYSAPSDWFKETNVISFTMFSIVWSIWSDRCDQLYDIQRHEMTGVISFMIFIIVWATGNDRCDQLYDQLEEESLEEKHFHWRLNFNNTLLTLY